MANYILSSLGIVSSSRPPSFPHLLQKGVVERCEVVVDDGIVHQLLLVLHQSALREGRAGTRGERGIGSMPFSPIASSPRFRPAIHKHSSHLELL